MSADVKIFECPHCHGGIEIIEIACGIFRHGYINGQQLPPHAPKEQCEDPKIIGCGKPFKYENGTLVKCDYI